jgi:hypothetical protein
MPKAKKYVLLGVLCIFLFILAGMCFNYFKFAVNALKLLWSMLVVNFGEITLIVSFVLVIIFAVLVFIPASVVWLILKTVTSSKNKKAQTSPAALNARPFWTISIMLFTLLSGATLLLFYFGFPPLSASLLSNWDNSFVGALNCTTTSGTFVVGEPVSCSLPIGLNITEVSYFIEFKNGSKQFYTGRSVSFYPEENTIGVVFTNITGFNKEGKQESFNAILRYVFPNRLDFSQVQQKILIYFFALMGIVFFTVPQFVLTMETIFEKKHEQRRGGNRISVERKKKTG